MNIYWNLVNLAIAGYGIWSASNLATEITTDSQFTDDRRKLENFLWLNVGLDVAYLVAGWTLLQRGERRAAFDDGSRWSGFGPSLLVQGAFLLAFDVSLLVLTKQSPQPLSIALLPRADGVESLLRWAF